MTRKTNGVSLIAKKGDNNKSGRTQSMHIEQENREARKTAIRTRPQQYL